MYQGSFFAATLLIRKLMYNRNSLKIVSVASSVVITQITSSTFCSCLNVSYNRSSYTSLKQYKVYSTYSNPHFKNGIPISQAMRQDEEREATTYLENLPAEEKIRLEILKLEHDYLLNQGMAVPQEITDVIWKEALNCRSRRGRLRQYKFWMKRELLRAKRRRPRVEEKCDRLCNGTATYGNKLMKRMKHNEYSKCNLAYSMMNGPHLVFDMGYTNMNHREEQNLRNQIVACHGFNKRRLEPFHFHFCNLKIEKQRLFDRFCPGFHQLLYTMTDDSYLDCYSKDELLYLSPDAKDTLETFDHNKVYIIGGMVDKTKIEPLSWAKCGMEKVSAVKLPLDKYFKWTKGPKALTLDQVVKILHTLKETNDMRAALTHVPTRKREWREQYKYNDIT